MLVQDDPKNPSKEEQIIMAVVIAGLSALATGLVSWGVEELKNRFGSKSKEEEEEKP